MNETIVINEGTTFMVTDSMGNVPRGSPLGLFRSDTRYLNKYVLRINTQEMIPLSFTRRGYIANISLTNPELRGQDGKGIPEGTLHILRTMFISTNFYEKLFVKNTNSFPVQLRLALSYDTDFRDIFEVKGSPAARRGLRAIIEGEDGQNIILRYEGLDNVIRRTEFYFKPVPDIYWDTAVFNVEVAPYETREIDIEVVMTLGGVPVMRQEYGVAKKEIEQSYDQWMKGLTQISTDNDVMNSVIETCILDLQVADHQHEEGAAGAGRGHPVVRHDLRPGQPHHQPADADAEPHAVAVDAAVPDDLPGQQGRYLDGRAAGKDTARDTGRGTGQPAPHPAHAVLRDHRRHAAVPHPHVGVEPLAGRLEVPVRTCEQARRPRPGG